MERAQSPYDVVDYPAYSYPNTHPDRLAVMAALHGVVTTPVTSCRVLEIGCGEGANLVPMAYALPRAEFTGFDLAGAPIARGQGRIRELGLDNVRLFQGDVLEVGEEPERGGLGEYDFIIAHGLYAWVPPCVQERLLALCGEHLAAHGIAFISYNALPGSHMRNIFRDVMVSCAHSGETPAEKVRAGLDLLATLLASRPENDPYRQLIHEQLTKLSRRSVESIYHDELSPVYAPVLVSTFVEHARQHGLEYLSEAVLPIPSDPCFRPELVERLRGLAGSDVVALEQMLDFARMRMFRETLLVHAGQPVQRELVAESLHSMRFASQATAAERDPSGTQVYTLADGLRVGSEDAPAIAVMERLIAAWPGTLGYAELRDVLAAAGVAAEASVDRLLQQMAVTRMIELHMWEAPVAAAVSERPRATAASRQEARMHTHLANLWHGTVQVQDPVVRALLQLLDGTRDRAALLAALGEAFPAMTAGELESGLEPNLAHFLRAALLEACHRSGGQR